MVFTRNDFIRFAFYTLLFFVLFFGYNRASSPYFETTYDSASINNQEVTVAKENPGILPAAPELSNPASDITIVFNPDYIELDATLLEHLKENINSSLFEPKIIPLNLVIDGERKDPRGQVVGNKLILSSSVTDDSEMMKVLVHELGHIVDIFYLKKGVLGDPSDIFYSIAWQDFNVKKKNMKIADFVSGYALSNKYEDFAESFAFYVFHNDEFVRRAQTDTFLRAKYDFFRKYVFDHDEFVGTSFESARLASYNWDVTKIPVNTKKYLYYIR